MSDDAIQVEVVEPEQIAIVETEPVEQVSSEHEVKPEPAKIEEEDTPIPKGVQKRIDRAVRQKYEAEAEAKFLREQNQRLQAEMQQKPVKAEQQLLEPKLDDYQDYDTYLNAKAEFIAERKVQETFAQMQHRAAMEQAQAAQRQTVESWNKRVSSATADLPDFADVVGSSDVPMPDHVRAVVMQSEQGPKLAYYLATHPDEAEQIATQHPLAAIRALMRIEDKIEAVKTANKTTNAPAPITPTGAKAKSEKDPSEMTDKEFNDWRRRQISQRR